MKVKDEKEKEIEELKEKQKKFDETIKNLEKEKNEKEQKIKELEKEKNENEKSSGGEMTQKEKQLRENLENAKKEKEEYEQKINEYEKKIEEYEKQGSQLSKQVKLLNAQNKELSKREIMIRGELEKMKEQKEKIENEYNELQNEKKNITPNEYNNKIKKLENEKKELEKKIIPIQNTLKEYRNENEQLKEKIEKLEKSKGIKIEDYESKAEFNIYLKESLFDLKNKNVSFFENKEIAGLEDEISDLEKIDDENSGLEKINDKSGLEKINDKSGLEKINDKSGLEKIKDEESSKIGKLIEKCHSNRQNNLNKEMEKQLIILRDLYLKEKLKNEKNLETISDLERQLQDLGKKKEDYEQLTDIIKLIDVEKDNNKKIINIVSEYYEKEFNKKDLNETIIIANYEEAKSAFFSQRERIKQLKLYINRFINIITKLLGIEKINKSNYIKCIYNIEDEELDREHQLINYNRQNGENLNDIKENVIIFKNKEIKPNKKTEENPKFLDAEKSYSYLKEFTFDNYFEESGYYYYIYSFKIELKNGSYLFYNCLSLEELDLSKFNSSNITTNYWMFRQCSSLKKINLTNFDTSNSENMSDMFYGCKLLEEINVSSFNTQKVIIMRGLFNCCSKLKQLDLTNFDTKNVNDMCYMFNECFALESIKGLDKFDTQKVTNMDGMFYKCTNLKQINIKFNTINVESMNYMFSQCDNIKELNLSSFKSNKLKEIKGMFSKCKQLKNIVFGNDFNTNNVTDMRWIFSNLSGTQIVTKDKKLIDEMNKVTKTPKQ